MKDSRKLKKKPKKFKFKKHPQPPQDEKFKVQAKTQQEDLKKSLQYNRSFIKNFILNKKEKIEQEKNKADLPKATQTENTEEKKRTNFFAKFRKTQEKKETAKLKTEIKIKNQPSPAIGEQKNNLWTNTFIIYKRIEKDLLLTLIPIILVFILALLNLMSNQVVGQIAQNKLSDIDYQVTVHPYPIVISPINPNLSAQTAIIMDKDSQVILYAKNPTIRFSMASTTKLMTALVGLEFYHPDSILTIKTPHVEGSNLGFYAGEQFTFQDLLYAMMLPSSNEAAYAVAENYPGGKDAFIAKMNDKAKQLHLQNTNYGDPAGLDDDQNFSTVVDLARLASIDLENPLLAQIVATKEQILIDRSGRQLPIHSLNQLLGIDGINGVKTGTTEAAGEVLITSTVQNNHTYIVVVMRSDQRFADTLTLVHALINNITYIQPQFTEQ